MKVFCAYDPTLISTDEAKGEFYENLYSVLQCTNPNDKLVLFGDFNARVGKDRLVWGDVLGRHSTGKMNNDGLRLLTLCQEFNLQLTNTTFQLADIYKNTWKHPHFGHWCMLDHVAIR